MFIASAPGFFFTKLCLNPCNTWYKQTKSVSMSLLLREHFAIFTILLIAIPIQLYFRNRDNGQQLSR